MIAGSLGLEGANREALLSAAEAGRRRVFEPAPAVLAMPRGVTDFAGRAWEVGFLARLVDPQHTGPAPVVVVAGTPGVGKTSFAVHAAAELAEDFPDGALFVDLRGLDDHPLEPNVVLGRLAGLALGQDKPRVAARLLGASGYARRIVGVAVWPGMQSIDQAQRAAVTAALSQASFAAATAEGAQMRIPDALAYGLEATAAKQVSDPFPAWASRMKSAT